MFSNIGSSMPIRSSLFSDEQLPQIETLDPSFVQQGQEDRNDTHFQIEEETQRRTPVVSYLVDPEHSASTDTSSSVYQAPGKRSLRATEEILEDVVDEKNQTHIQPLNPIYTRPSYYQQSAPFNLSSMNSNNQSLQAQPNSLVNADLIGSNILIDPNHGSTTSQRTQTSTTETTKQSQSNINKKRVKKVLTTEPSQIAALLPPKRLRLIEQLSSGNRIPSNLNIESNSTFAQINPEKIAEIIKASFKEIYSPYSQRKKKLEECCQLINEAKKLICSRNHQDLMTDTSLDKIRAMRNYIQQSIYQTIHRGSNVELHLNLRCLRLFQIYFSILEIVICLKDVNDRHERIETILDSMKILQQDLMIIFQEIDLQDNKLFKLLLEDVNFLSITDCFKLKQSYHQFGINIFNILCPTNFGAYEDFLITLLELPLISNNNTTLINPSANPQQTMLRQTEKIRKKSAILSNNSTIPEIMPSPALQQNSAETLRTNSPLNFIGLDNINFSQVEHNKISEISNLCFNGFNILFSDKINMLQKILGIIDKSKILLHETSFNLYEIDATLDEISSISVHLNSDIYSEANEQLQLYVRCLKLLRVYITILQISLILKHVTRDAGSKIAMILPTMPALQQDLQTLIHEVSVNSPQKTQVLINLILLLEDVTLLASNKCAGLQSKYVQSGLNMFNIYNPNKIESLDNVLIKYLSHREINSTDNQHVFITPRDSNVQYPSPIECNAELNIEPSSQIHQQYSEISSTTITTIGSGKIPLIQQLTSRSRVVPNLNPNENANFGAAPLNKKKFQDVIDAALKGSNVKTNPQRITCLDNSWMVIVEARNLIRAEKPTRENFETTIDIVAKRKNRLGQLLSKSSFEDAPRYKKCLELLQIYFGILEITLILKDGRKEDKWHRTTKLKGTQNLLSGLKVLIANINIEQNSDAYLINLLNLILEDIDLLASSKYPQLKQHYDKFGIYMFNIYYPEEFGLFENFLLKLISPPSRDKNGINNTSSTTTITTNSHPYNGSSAPRGSNNDVENGVIEESNVHQVAHQPIAYANQMAEERLPSSVYSSGTSETSSSLSPGAIEESGLIESLFYQDLPINFDDTNEYGFQGLGKRHNRDEQEIEGSSNNKYPRTDDYNINFQDFDF